MDEEEHLHRFGTPLEPLEKDEVPAKKPVALEDQIVKDENGKRRFHGAFTGGFSAGFWNTVGSLEGWTPQNFKSSRGEKASKVEQRAEDFMDSEDLGEFGIAPQGIRTRDEFSKESEVEQRLSQRKRKLMQSHVAGPIPGVPVLEHMLHTVRENVAVRILKSMGWKSGQGVGPRQTHKEKRQSTARNKREQYLLEHYEPEELPGNKNCDNETDEENLNELENITFAPDDYEPLFYKPKCNRFGISYSGLSRVPVLSKGSAPEAPMERINIFGQLKTIANNKQLSIRGQAFGVGAFEEEDDDIYAKDDMTRYDFSLAEKQPKQKKIQHLQQHDVIGGFSEEIICKPQTNMPYAIDLARNFQPRNWLLRLSRFAPMNPERAQKLAQAGKHKKVCLGRHDLSPEKRAQLLGESVSEKNPFKSNSCTIGLHKSSKSLLELIGGKDINFTKGGLITSTDNEHSLTTGELNKELQQSNAKLLEQTAAKASNFAPCPTVGGFKPFLSDGAKQQRYEKFLAANLKSENEITEFLVALQPATFSLWDREMEKKEFIQSSKIYKPLEGLMHDRFVSEATVQAKSTQEQAQVEKRKIVLERTKTMWKPNALLCKRYNIAEPYGGALPEDEKEQKPKPKISIFDYLETSVNRKENFQTPSIIPKFIETTKTQPSGTTAQTTIVEETKSLPAAETKQFVSSTPINPTSVPKTQLEQHVDATRDKPISEKIDLFKSIFDDSDNEAEYSTKEDQQPANDKQIAMQVALGLPSSASTAAAANVLRNSSPPRGIFAALFKPAEEQVSNSSNPVLVKHMPIEGNKLKISYKSRNERFKNFEEQNVAPAEELYGPKLPCRTKQIPIVSSVQAEANIDAKLLQLWEQHATSKRKVERWVERKLTSSDESDEGSSSSSASSKSNLKKIRKKSFKTKSHNKVKEKTKKKSKKSHKSKHKSKKKGKH